MPILYYFQDYLGPISVLFGLKNPDLLRVWLVGCFPVGVVQFGAI